MNKILYKMKAQQMKHSALDMCSSYTTIGHAHFHECDNTM